MPILEIIEDRLDQKCAKCGHVHQLPLDDLVAGVNREGQGAAQVISLPSCTECGAKEFLVRSPDDEPEHSSPGCYVHRHRLLVDNVHANLMKRGQVAEGFDPKSIRPRKGFSNKLKKWFPKGLKLERQEEQKEHPDVVGREPNAE
ncbi:MAG: hypothetical protein GY854_00245 [Deltaproteobacteria bacterium]|nr:hypothetical protein [Deltaproteobacteria bacterium]